MATLQTKTGTMMLLWLPFRQKNREEEITLATFRTKNGQEKVTLAIFLTKNREEEVTLATFQTKNREEEVTMATFQTKTGTRMLPWLPFRQKQGGGSYSGHLSDKNGHEDVTSDKRQRGKSYSLSLPLRPRRGRRKLLSPSFRQKVARKKRLSPNPDRAPSHVTSIRATLETSVNHPLPGKSRSTSIFSLSLRVRRGRGKVLSPQTHSTVSVGKGRLPYSASV